MPLPTESLSISAIENYGNTQLSGTCTVPGVHSSHQLTITIFNSDTPPEDVTSSFGIEGPTLNEGGQWFATISPTLDRNSGYSVEVSCLHDGQTVTATFEMINASTGVM